jgi:hypothetical protein
VGHFERLGGGIGFGPPAQQAKTSRPERHDSNSAKSNVSSRDHGLSLSVIAFAWELRRLFFCINST